MKTRVAAFLAFVFTGLVVLAEQRTDSSRAAQEHLTRAAALYAEANVEGAVTEYREAIKLNPGFPEAYSGLCHLQTLQNNFDGAISQCRQAIRLRPGYAEAHYHLANALALKGELADAKTEYRKVVTPATPEGLEQYTNVENNDLVASGSLIPIRRRDGQLYAGADAPDIPDMQHLGPALMGIVKRRADIAQRRGVSKPATVIGVSSIDFGEVEQIATIAREYGFYKFCILVHGLKATYAEEHYTLAETLALKNNLAGAKAEYRKVVTPATPEGLETYTSVETNEMISRDRLIGVWRKDGQLYAYGEATDIEHLPGVLTDIAKRRAALQKPAIKVMCISSMPFSEVEQVTTIARESGFDRVCIQVKQHAQTTVAAIMPPDGWSQEMMGESVMMTSPGTSDVDHVLYLVRPSERFSGTFEGWFTRRLTVLAPSLGKVTQQSGVFEQNGVLLDLVGIQLDDGERVRAFLFGYPVGDKGQVFLIMVPQAIADRDPRVVAALAYARALFHNHFILESKSMTATSRADNSTPTQGVMGPGKGFGEGLSGVYLGTGWRSALTAGSGLQRINDVRIIVVLPDGKWRDSLPYRGLEIDIAADRREVDSWGVWTASGGVVRATATNDEVVLDPQSWTKLSPIDGLRPDGVFVREDSGLAGDEPKLVLHADGTFEDRSGLSNLVGLTTDFDGVPRQLTEQQEAFLQRPGDGNYEFRNFTLLLRFSDGRVRRMSAYVPPNDNSKRPRRLVIQNGVLVRK